MFRKAGITKCELKYAGCTNFALGFAHSLRRTVIKQYTGEEYEAKLTEVILACQPCHAKLDAQKRHVTEAEVLEIIQNRKKPIEWEYAVE